MSAPSRTTVDVVVVGAGGAGMCAALAAAKQGLDVVLVEKSGYFGGSTARSGGGVWMPGNAALKAAGQVSADDLAQAKLYLDSIVGDEVPEGPPRHLPRPRPRGARLHPRRTRPVRFQWVPQYADYHPEAPGGRAARPLVRAGPAGRAVPRRRARPAAPAVHQGAGEHDRDAGRLPEDQPRAAHLARAGRRWSRSWSTGIVSGLLRPPDVRHGQRDRDRPAQGADRRRRAGRTTTPSCSGPARSRTAGSPASGSPTTARTLDDPGPPRRDPRQRRLREEPRDAREVPAAPDLGRLDDRVRSSTPAAASSPASRPAPRPP